MRHSNESAIEPDFLGSRGFLASDATRLDGRDDAVDVRGLDALDERLGAADEEVVETPADKGAFTRTEGAFKGFVYNEVSAGLGVCEEGTGRVRDELGRL